MTSPAYSCPTCRGSLTAYPGFGVDWRCPACGSRFIALKTADGRPLALDAAHGVFGWDAAGLPRLIQPSVPHWQRTRVLAQRPGT